MAGFIRNGYELADRVSWVKGRHSFSFGFSIDKQHVDIRNLFLRPGTVVFNGDVPALDEADRTKPLPEALDIGRITVRRRRAEKSDHRHRRLLRPCHHRPRSRTAEQRDELAPSHSITSSAVASSASGTVGRCGSTALIGADGEPAGGIAPVAK